MNLDEFFRAITPFLEGREALSETAPRLYGPGWAGRRDAQRLAIYGRFCRVHRFEALDGVYAHSRRAVHALAGEAAWDELVEGYFRAHPMRSFELNENGAAFPSYLKTALAGRGDLAAWLPELADFEWWEWQTESAADSEGDAAPGSGPLRIGDTVELRRYEHDLLAWIEEEADGPPVRRECLVLFWRDRDLAPRREAASALELLVLKMVQEGATIEGLLAQGSGLPRQDLEETLADLYQAGILLGTMPGDYSEGLNTKG